MQGVGKDGHAVGQVGADDFNDCEAQIEEKRGAQVGRVIVMMVMKVMAAAVFMDVFMAILVVVLVIMNVPLTHLRPPRPKSSRTKRVERRLLKTNVALTGRY